VGVLWAIPPARPPGNIIENRTADHSVDGKKDLTKKKKQGKKSDITS
jgi:hypothetical protein